MRRLVLVAGILGLAVSAVAQDAGTLKVQARLVHLPAVVHNSKGSLVLTLKKADFSLKVDGKDQEIRYFNNDANLPLTVGLLVDTSMSLRDKLDEERSASTKFLDQMLESEQDRAFVIQFAQKADLLADLTNSRAKLQEGLRQLEAGSPGFGRDARRGDPDDDKPAPPSQQWMQWGGQRGGGHRGGGTGGGMRGSGGGTVLYDAVFLASDELMKKQTGRKALVVLTDGQDRGSQVRLTRALEAAQRADTIVYAIYYKGEEPRTPMGFGGGGRGGPMGGRGGGWPGGGGQGGGREQVDGKKILERIAGETGGRMFEVTKKESVEQIYAEIARELRSQYRIEFTPGDTTGSEGYHQVELLVKDKKMYVQTRDGYYIGEPSR